MTSGNKIYIAGAAVLLVLAVLFFAGYSQEPGTSAPAPLVDGTKIEWLGVYHASPVAGGVKSFSSDELGVSFKYPDGYLLFQYDGDGSNNPIGFHSIQIGPEAPVLETIQRAAAGFYGEGPAAISLAFYPNPDSFPLKQWMDENKAQSNFDPADPTNALAPAAVAGVSALSYHSSMGLYSSTDYVAFLYKDWVVIAVSPDVGEDSDRDFHMVLSSMLLK